MIARSGRRAGGFARTLGSLYLRFFGWRVEGELPAGTIKAVVVAAPHTSNWDLPFALAVSYVLGAKPSWLGKRELFRWPFGWFLRALGGVPVDRHVRTNFVQQAVECFAGVERLFLVVPPSGTRKGATHWKSGFYHIARGAGVPIICTFLDYKRRAGGVRLVLEPTGDVAADMALIRQAYDQVSGMYPERLTPIRLLEESAPDPTSTSAASGA